MEEQFKLKRKGEFLPRNWIVSLLIFFGIFALLALSSGSVLEKYGKTDYIDNEIKDNYDQFNNLSEDYRGLFQDMTNEDKGLLSIIFGDSGFFKGFISLIKLIWNSVSMLDNITANFMQDFGIPEGIANIIFPLVSAIVVVLLIFTIISSANRGSKI